MILEDDESDTPDPEATAVSALVDAGADSTFELSKPIDPSGHEAWHDVEDDRFVDKDLRPFPPLEQEVLASTLAQGQPHSRYHSPGPSHDRINQHDGGNTQRTSEELRHGSPLRSQDQEEEPQEQQRQEVAVYAMREVEDDGELERGERGEKRGRQDGKEEVSSDMHQPESSDYSHNTKQ